LALNFGLDVHLSHVVQMVWQGYFGHLGIALVEVAGRRSATTPR
jgi:hypothetical protein